MNRCLYAHRAETERPVRKGLILLQKPVVCLLLLLLCGAVSCNVGYGQAPVAVEDRFYNDEPVLRPLFNDVYDQDAAVSIQSATFDYGSGTITYSDSTIECVLAPGIKEARIAYRIHQGSATSNQAIIHIIPIPSFTVPEPNPEGPCLGQNVVNLGDFEFARTSNGSFISRYQFIDVVKGSGGTVSTPDYVFYSSTLQTWQNSYSGANSFQPCTSANQLAHLPALAAQNNTPNYVYAGIASSTNAHETIAFGLNTTFTNQSGILQFSLIAYKGYPDFASTPSVQVRLFEVDPSTNPPATSAFLLGTIAVTNVCDEGWMQYTINFDTGLLPANKEFEFLEMRCVAVCPCDGNPEQSAYVFFDNVSIIPTCCEADPGNSTGPNYVFDNLCPTLNP